MTVSSGDWGQNEFENAILSIQKYQDNPKTDFANLLGVSYNNVREILLLSHFQYSRGQYFIFSLDGKRNSFELLKKNCHFKNFFSGWQQYQDVKMPIIQMHLRPIRYQSCPRPNVFHCPPNWQNSSITCKLIGKLEFLPKLVVHGLQLMQIYSFGNIKQDMIWLILTNYQVGKP